MLMQNPRARDWWLYPVIIETGVNDQLIIREDPTDYTLTISAGTYYMHAQNDADYPGLYYAIEQAIAATAASNAYNFYVATPSVSYEQDRGGVILTDAVGAFSLKFTSSRTMPQKWFGLPSGTTTFAAALDANTSLYGVTSHYRCHGIMRTETIDGSGIASIKRGQSEKEVYDSHNRQTRYSLVWGEYTACEFSYEYVLAAHVFTDDAGEMVDYATLGARLGVGDNCSTWEDFFVRYAEGRNLLLLPDLEDWDLRISRTDGTYCTTHKRYEQANGEQALNDIITRRATAGEAYDISFKTYLTDTTT